MWWRLKYLAIKVWGLFPDCLTRNWKFPKYPTQWIIFQTATFDKQPVSVSDPRPKTDGLCLHHANLQIHSWEFKSIKTFSNCSVLSSLLTSIIGNIGAPPAQKLLSICELMHRNLRQILCKEIWKPACAPVALSGHYIYILTAFYIYFIQDTYSWSIRVT